MPSVFFVTGSSRGLGRAITEAALSAGHQVAASARHPEQLDDLARKYGDQILPLSLDVTDYRAAIEAVSEAAAAFGRVDVVVNNAGNSTLGRIENLPEADWDSIIDTHLKGTFLVTKHALRHMHARRIKGVIINTSSVESFATTTGNAHYSAAKAGIDKLTQVAALEAGPLGIRVNAVAPGAVATTIGQDIITPAFNQAWHDTFSIQRMGQPADIAKAVTFLASDYAEWITGITLLIDGGSHLRGIPDYARYLLPNAS